MPPDYQCLAELMTMRWLCVRHDALMWYPGAMTTMCGDVKLMRADMSISHKRRQRWKYFVPAIFHDIRDAD